MSIMPDKRRQKRSVLVYVFFMVAVGIFFFEQAREGKIVITSHPSGAQVFLDKKDLGRTPATISVKRGEHRIDAALEGYEPVSHTVTIEAGKTISLELELRQITQ